MSYVLRSRPSAQHSASRSTTREGALRAKGAEILGRRPEPGLLLLADLRRVYRMAAGASLDWEVLGQTAQATQAQRSDNAGTARTVTAAEGLIRGLTD